MSPYIPEPEPAQNSLPTTQLRQCPVCHYSFNGLPDVGRCPECGLVYDEQSYLFRAVMRGTSGTSKSRMALWFIVGVSAWFALSFGLQFLIIYGMSAGFFGTVFLFAVWCALVIYLLVTAKYHRGQKGVEYFLFCAEGFGPCAVLHGASTPIDAKIILWSEVDAFTFDGIGSNFHRLRIGRKHPHKQKLSTKTIGFDVGVRCNASQAHTLARFISRQMNPTMTTPDDQ